MTAVHTLPEPATVGQLLGNLFGKKVTTTKAAAKVVLGPRTPGALGVFVADDGQPAALVYCDVAIACSAGAALALVPPATALETVKSNTIPANLLENLHEVINVARSWFESAGAPRVKLAVVHAPPWTLAKEELALAMKPTERLDLDIEITGYAKGKMCLLVL